MCQLRKLCDKLLKRDAELSCSLRNQQPIQDLVDALRSNKQDPSHDEKKMISYSIIIIIVIIIVEMFSIIISSSSSSNSSIIIISSIIISSSIISILIIVMIIIIITSIIIIVVVIISMITINIATIITIIIIISSSSNLCASVCKLVAGRGPPPLPSPTRAAPCSFQSMSVVGKQRTVKKEQSRTCSPTEDPKFTCRLSSSLCPLMNCPSKDNPCPTLALTKGRRLAGYLS